MSFPFRQGRGVVLEDEHHDHDCERDPPDNLDHGWSLLPTATLARCAVLRSLVGSVNRAIWQTVHLSFPFPKRPLRLCPNHDRPSCTCQVERKGTCKLFFYLDPSTSNAEHSRRNIKTRERESRAVISRHAQANLGRNSRRNIKTRARSLRGNIKTRASVCAPLSPVIVWSLSHLSP